MAHRNDCPDGTKAPVSIEWIAPPTDLTDLVHAFYAVEIGDGKIDEPIPAYSAQLLIVERGVAELEYTDGVSSRTDTLFLKAPQLSAGRVRVDGPFKAVAASLTPLGWAVLTAQPVDAVHDCEIQADKFIPTSKASDFLASAEKTSAGEMFQNDGLAFLVSILRKPQHSVTPRNRQFVETFTRWLGSDINPPLELLYEDLALSPRQIQRLSRRFFGASPTQVLLRHRAIRIAMMLSNPGLPQPLRDELTAAYFDQAHLIRNLRRFTGRTPADLGLRSLAEQSLDPAGHGATAALLKAEND